ncbi:MAG TPA: GAF domain-containing protein [Candidatus Dormibacteraeota bacterium]|jgi:diguanylate cyclase (GGDEF)-like protein|nr:GAF domain-containing protein [Candidatus Dormibacteraeota bacterium]
MESDRGAELAMLMKAAESLLLAATQEREVLDAAMAILGERFGYGTRAMLLFDQQREELSVATAAGVGVDRPEMKNFRTRLGEGLTGTSALYRHIVNVPDVRRDSRYLRVLPETVSEIDVPLVARDDLLGVLTVQSPEVGHFNDRDEALLTAFSQLVALALVNARANQSRRRDIETISQRLSELQAVHEVAERGASLDLEGTLQAAVDAVQRLTGADSTALYVWHAEEDQLELAAITFDRRLYPSDYESRLRSLKPRLGEGLVGWVAMNRQALLLSDVTRDPRMVQLPGVPLEARSGIVVPILAEDRLLGVLRAWKLGSESFSQDHYRFVLTLASQTALALSAADAHREQTARIRQLGALYETSLRLSRSTTIDEVLDIVLRASVQMTSAERGVLWRLESDGSFSLAAFHEVPSEILRERPADVRDSVSADIVASGQAVIVADIWQDPRWTFREVLPMVRSMAGVPVRSEGVFYGTLVVAHSRVSFFRHEHVRHLEVLAAQAATTLARAQAFEEAHRLAITDELTGFYNSRYFTGRVQQEVQRAARYGHPLSLVMIDSDSLKNVNDRFGHDEGNRYLVELAQIIREKVRATDIVARFGGDEFLVLMPETELAAAVSTADRIRVAAARAFGPGAQEPIEVHVSGGIASYPATARDHEELFRQADHALYVAKRRGKNTVAAAPITNSIE